jgi:hypothetical protein
MNRWTESKSRSCGAPLHSELKQEQTGIKVYLDGHKAPMHKFIYAADTDQFPRASARYASLRLVGKQIPSYGLFSNSFHNTVPPLPFSESAV